MLVCAKVRIPGTRDRGCSAHPASPAPSRFRGPTLLTKPGRNAPRERDLLFENIGAKHFPSSLRTQGPIRRGRAVLRWRRRPCFDRERIAVWVPAFAGAQEAGWWGSVIARRPADPSAAV